LTLQDVMQVMGGNMNQFRVISAEFGVRNR
jgi:hypothetical protein